MCSITIATMALSAAQGVASISAQKQQAEAQEAAQSAASIREMQRQQMAMRSARMEQQQEETSTAQETLKSQREAEAAISTATVAGEAANVSGTSVGLNIQEFERANAEYAAALDLQSRMNDSARRLSLANSGEQYVSNMSAINKPIAQPDYLGTLLGTASNMAGAYQQSQLNTINRENMLLQQQSMANELGLGRQGLTIGSQNQRNLDRQRQAAGIGTSIQRGQSGLYSTNSLQIPRYR